MESTELNVILFGDSITSGPIVVAVSDPDEPAIDAMWREYYAVHRERKMGGPFEGGQARWTLTDGSGSTVYVGFDRRVTVGRFIEAFGPIATASPPQLTIAVDGVGGDSLPIDLLDSAFSGQSLYKTYKGGITAIDRLRFREHRLEVEEWQDTGEISMRLRQLVLAEKEWTPKLFTRRFAIDGSERGKLLRECGYASIKRGGRKLWVEVDPQP